MLKVFSEPGDSSTIRKYSLSIRQKLLLFVVIAFLPAIAVITYTGIEERSQEIETSTQKAMQMVRSLSAQQKQVAKGTELLLSTLAQLPEVQKSDVKACNRLFVNLHKQYPAYSTIAAATPDGNLFAASAPFEPGTVDLSDRKHIKDAIRTKAFSAGEYIVGRVSKVPSINYTYPVVNAENKLVAIVIAGFRLDQYAQYVRRANLPEGSAMTILDFKGLRLYRSPEHSTSAIGTPIPLDSIERIFGDREEGIYERKGEDGTYRIYAFKQLRLRDDSPPYMLITLGIPKEEITSAANRAMMANLLVLGISASVLMVLVWLFAELAFINPIRRLVTEEISSSNGQTLKGGDEIDQLAGTFRRIKSELKQTMISKAYMDRITNNMLGMLIVVGMDGRIQKVNPQVNELSGYDENALVGDCVEKILTTIQDKPLDINELSRMTTAAEMRGQDAFLCTVDGKKIPIIFNVTSIEGTEGEQDSVVCNAMDVTERKENLERLHKALGATVKAMAVAVEVRDAYTAGHQRRVSDLARAIATKMGLSSDRVDGLRMAASIHDLGKISIPAEILSKPANLSPVEFSLVQTHSLAGYDILKDIDFPQPVARMVLEHHERIDGSGYPSGLTGNQLLLESRILAVADVVESMASHRPYRAALGIDAALCEIAKNKGKLYDSAVVDACLRVFNEKGYRFRD